MVLSQVYNKYPEAQIIVHWTSYDGVNLIYLGHHFKDIAFSRMLYPVRVQKKDGKYHVYLRKED